MLNCAGSSLNSVEIAWESVAGATGYGLTINGEVINVDASTTSYAATGLGEGQEISASIIAYGAGACGNSASSFEIACKADNCPSKTIEILGLESSYCRSDGDVDLPLIASEPGGQFYVNGTAATNFSPYFIAAGTYIVTYELNQGACSYSAAPFEIEVLALPSVEIFGNPQFCTGESATFEASAGFASYLWSTGFTSNTITVTTGDTYSLTVTDANGCQATAAITANENTIEAPVIDANGLTAICAGELISLTVPDEYNTYVWENNASVEPSLLINGPGTYGLTVTDAAGCETSTSITLEEAFIESPALLVDGVAAAEENTICVGGNPVTIGVGSDYTNYVWSTGDDSATISVDQTGTYRVTVTNGQGCRASASITLTEEVIETPTQLINGEVTDVTSICLGTTDLELAIEGDFEGYVWSNGATDAQITVTPTEAMSYNVTVTNAKGCQITSNFIIEEKTITAPINLINGEATNEITICEGEVVSLSVDAAFDSYLWSTGATTTAITVSEAGTYRVVLTDVEGCMVAAEEITVNYKEPIGLALIATETSICAGNSTTITATEGLSNYTWIETGETSNSITVSQAGTYTVEVTENGCTKVESIVITEFESKLDALQIVADRSEICVGEEVVLTGEGLANAATFDWRGEGLNSTNTETVSANPTGAGIYTLLATDENGCAKTDTIEIGLNQVCDLPNAITPRQVDGRNDRWIIPQAYTNSGVGVQIFNRWGQKVWETTAYNNDNGWDGTNNNGNELPLGTYYYVIDLNDNQTDAIHGAVTILE